MTASSPRPTHHAGWSGCWMEEAEDKREGAYFCGNHRYVRVFFFKKKEISFRTFPCSGSEIEGGSCSPPELEDRAGFVGKPMYEIREVGGESVGGYLCRIRLGRAAAETDSGEWAVEAEDDGFWTKDIGRDVVQVKVM